MITDQASYRRILSSTAIVGGATVVSIVIGIVRTKIFALSIGVAGIGLLGVFTGIMGTAAAIGGMGLSFSGVREIAANAANRSLVRRALWLAVWPLAIVTALVLWGARYPLSRWIIGSDAQALGVGLTGVAAAVTIIAAAQLTVIQGVGHVSDVARVRIWGALLSLLIGVPAVLYAGRVGIVLAVIAIPLGNALAALPYRPRPDPPPGAITPARIAAEWKQLLTLGATLMVTSALASGALVVIRTLVIRHDGLGDAGLYQGAYAISALNASLVLSAMATDYFPRLSAAQSDRRLVETIVNQQLHAAVMLASPVLLAMAAAAPIVLNLLYSPAFAAGAGLLRWQLAGEILKLPGWALGFLLIARADKGWYLLVETAFVAVYIAGTAVLLPLLGLSGAGVAYVAAYVAYSLILILLCSRRHSVSISSDNQMRLLLAGAALVAIAMLGEQFPIAAGVVGGVAAAAAAAYALRHLNEFRLASRAAPAVVVDPAAPID